jgi:serine/threonine protein kinase
LHWACVKGHIDVVQFLVDSGANVNIADKDGKVPAKFIPDPTKKKQIQDIIARGPRLPVPPRVPYSAPAGSTSASAASSVADSAAPKRLEDHSPDEIALLLASWNLSVYRQTFIDNCIGGETLMMVDMTSPDTLRNDLVTALNVTTMNVIHARQLHAKLKSNFPASFGGSPLSPTSPISPPAASSTSTATSSGKQIYECNGARIELTSPDHPHSRVLRGRFTDTTNRAINCVVKRSTSADTHESLRKEVAMLMQINNHGDSFDDDSAPANTFTPVVRVFYTNTQSYSSTLYFVMEAYGNNLTQLLVHTCPKHTCESICLKLVACVQTLHGMGIMHGDLKPQNILYRSNAVDFEVKLCDLDSAAATDTEPFPFAISDDDDANGGSGFKYTPGYDCPEFIPGHKFSAVPGVLTASPRIDYFSLGLVLWQVFNNDPQSPLYGLNQASLLRLFGADAEWESKLRRLKHCTSISQFIVNLCKIDPQQRSLDYSIINEAFAGVTMYKQQIVQANSEIAYLRSLLDDKLNGFNDTFEQFVFEQTNMSNQKLLDNVCDLIQSSNKQLQSAIANKQTQQTAQILETLKEQVVVAVTHTDAKDVVVIDNLSATNNLNNKLNDIIDYMQSNNEQSVENTEKLMQSLSNLENELQAVRSDIQAMKELMTEFGDGLLAVIAGNEQIQRTLQVVTTEVHTLSKEDSDAKAAMCAQITGLQTALAALPAAINESTEAAMVSVRTQLSSQISAQGEKLNTLLRGTYSVPTLMVVLPQPHSHKASNATVKSTLQSLDPRKFIQDEFRLHFMCAHTLRMVPCGPKGHGYKFSAIKPWVKKAAPLLLVGLCLLQVGLTASGLPIPVPGLGQLMKSFNEYEEYLEGMISFVSAFDAEDVEAAEGITIDKHDLQESSVKTSRKTKRVNGGLPDVSSEGSREAFMAVKELMDKLDPALQQTGLRFVTDSSSGVSQWIQDSEEVEASFRFHRGARQPVVATTTAPRRAAAKASSAASDAPAVKQTGKSFNKWFS